MEKNKTYFCNWVPHFAWLNKNIAIYARSTLCESTSAYHIVYIVQIIVKLSILYVTSPQKA